MRQKIENIFEKLFRDKEFENWTLFHKWLYTGSDILIWIVFLVISLIIVYYSFKKQETPVRSVLISFSILLFFSGFAFISEIISLNFPQPVYNIDFLIVSLTAFIALITLIIVLKELPVIRLLKTPAEFEKELTERKKSQSKFMALLESAPDAVIITTNEGKILMANKQTEDLFGFHREEIINKPVETLIPKKYEQTNTNDNNSNKDNVRIDNDLYGKRKDQTEFPVEVTLRSMKVDNESTNIVIAAIRDITKQKKAESKIKELNNNLEQLVKQRTIELEQALKNEKTIRNEMSRNHERLEFLIEAGEMLASTLNYCDVLFNLSKIIVPSVADWCVIYEHSENGTPNLLIVSHKNAEMNKTIYDLMEKYPPNGVFSLGISHVLNTGNVYLHEIVNEEDIHRIAKDHEHLKLLNTLDIRSLLIVPLNNREKTVGALMVVISDSEKHYNKDDVDLIKETSRRAMLAIENAKLYDESLKINALLEQRVEKRTKELITINKELEAFSYSVSHDLRAPLRSIDGFSNFILKNYQELLDDQGRDYFDRIKKASKYMGQLIDDLLKLSQLSRTSVHPDYINLSDIAEAIINDLRTSDIERNVEFIIKPEMIAKADHNLMRIVLQNLFNNAWKYTKNNKRTIIEFSSYKKDNSVVFYIKDNGVGFDMKYSDKLFGSFQRLHSSSEFEGTGVGLAIVQRIINRHNGTIWAVSEINNGATFYFII